MVYNIFIFILKLAWILITIDVPLYSQFQTRYDVCQKLYSVNETQVESSESKSKRRLNVGDFL